MLLKVELEKFRLEDLPIIMKAFLVGGQKRSPCRHVSCDAGRGIIQGNKASPNQLI